jgi:hypothetical protein
MMYREFVNEQGFLIKEFKNNDGELHNDKGPAFMVYDKNGHLILEKFCVNGKMHRTDGPATIWYKTNNYSESLFFYLDGICFGRCYVGFWSFWDKLSDDERRHINILKLVVKYSGS